MLPQCKPYVQNTHYNIYIVYKPHQKGKELKQIRHRMEKQQSKQQLPLNSLHVNSIPGKIVNWLIIQVNHIVLELSHICELRLYFLSVMWQ